MAIGVANLKHVPNLFSNASEPVSASPNLSLNVSGDKGTIDPDIFGYTVQWDHDVYRFFSLIGQMRLTELPHTESDFYDGAGLEYEKIKEYGIHSMRFPYGCLADTYDYHTGNATYYAADLKQNLDNPLGTIDNAIALSKNNGGSLNYVVNINYDKEKQNCNLLPRYPGRDAATNKQILLNDAKEIVKKYGTQLKYYELGNEQWASWGDPVRYMNTVKDFAKAMKEVNPNIKISLIASYYGWPNYTVWNQGVKKDIEMMCGPVKCFDGIAIHFYDANGYNKNAPVSSTNYKGVSAYWAQDKYTSYFNQIRTMFPGKALTLTEWQTGSCAKAADYVFETGMYTYEVLKSMIANKFSSSNVSELRRGWSCSFVDDFFSTTFSGKVFSMMSQLGGMKQLGTTIPLNYTELKNVNFANAPAVSVVAGKKDGEAVVLLSNKATTNVNVKVTFGSDVPVSTLSSYEIETVGSNDYTSSKTYQHYKYGTSKATMDVSLPALSVTKVRLSKNSVDSMKRDRMWSRVCEYDETNGVPIANTCTGYNDYSLTKLGLPAGTSIGSYESSYFANNTQFKQTFVVENSTVAYTRNCTVSPTLKTPVCKNPFSKVDLKTLWNLNTSSIAGISSVNYGAKSKKFVMDSTSLYTLDCSYNDATGAESGCNSTSKTELSNLRGTTGERYSAIESFLFDNNTKIRFSFIDDTGTKGFYRSCPFNPANGGINCSGIAFNEVSYGSLRAVGQERYYGYATNVFVQRGKQYIRQDYLGYSDTTTQFRTEGIQVQPGNACIAPRDPVEFTHPYISKLTEGNSIAGFIPVRNSTGYTIRIDDVSAGGDKTTCKPYDAATKTTQTSWCETKKSRDDVLLNFYIKNGHRYRITVTPLRSCPDGIKSGETVSREVTGLPASNTPTPTYAPQAPVSPTPANTGQNMVYRDCEWDDAAGQPISGKCSTFSAESVSNLRSTGGNEKYSAYETYLFNKGTMVRQSFVSSDGTKGYYRSCPFNPATKLLACTAQFTEYPLNFLGKAGESYGGYGTYLYTQNGIKKMRQHYLTSTGDAQIYRDCTYNETTGNPVTCSSFTPFSVAGLRSGGTNERYGSYTTFLFNNGTKLRQSYVTKSGNEAYYRSCDFNQSTAAANCPSGTGAWNSSPISNLRGGSNERYDGYGTLFFTDNGKKYIRQYYLTPVQ